MSRFEMNARRDGRCADCGGAIAAGDLIHWDFEAKKAYHAVCPEVPVLAPERKASEGQLTLIRDLGGDAEVARSLTVKEASVLIDALKQSLPGKDVVPNGRYCLERQDVQESDDDGLYFVRVYHGRSKVYAYLLHGPDESPIAARPVLEAIVVAGPFEAAVRYAREIGSCSVCNARLTNNLSRELGIGPVCGGRFFEKADWKERRRVAKTHLQAQGIDPDASSDTENPQMSLEEVA